ncbi:TPA_asm: RNA-directed RNA polymerase, partial [ssRNA phage SRR5466725_18]
MRPLIDVVKTYLVHAATPFCREQLELVERGDWDALVTRKVNPESYTHAYPYLLDAQAAAFFTKNADWPTKHDRRKAALDAWYEAEGRCALTNKRLNDIMTDLNDQDDCITREFLARVRRRVSWWLGPVPDELHARFGPGVTLCCRGQASTVADKMTKSPTTTVRARELALPWFEKSLWARNLLERGVLKYEDGVLSGFDDVTSSRWDCVPKDAKTDRSIEIGPNLNVAYQLYIGKTMKMRFARRGWDLLHAADSHRRVACEASISGSMATIDLKQASDSLSRGLVSLCVPELWLSLLETFRVPKIEIDGKTVRVNKFSGMGNGYTFELESVLFMSIAQEVCSMLGLPSTANRDVYVFGDDIIVPTAASGLLVKVLSLLGFETNASKTFVDGPFRESCGGDFFRGMRVRPHYLKEIPNEPQQWIAFANGLRRAVSSDGADLFDHVPFRRAWLRVLDSIPTAAINRGPVSMGDLVLHDAEHTWTTKRRHGIRYLRVTQPVVDRRPLRFGGSLITWDHFHDEVQLAAAIYGS